MLGEFVRATAPFQWDQIALPDWRTFSAAQINDELYELYQLIDYRPGVMAEALAEIQGIQSYWQGLLMCNPRSHPATCYLMDIAVHVGEFQAMHYKYNWTTPTGDPVFGRPRASQLSPALMPPIAVPGHASYPSGHSTQTHLLSGLLAQVMPNPVSAPLPINASPKAPPNPVQPPIPALPAADLSLLIGGRARFAQPRGAGPALSFGHTGGENTRGQKLASAAQLLNGHAPVDTGGPGMGVSIRKLRR